MVDSLHTSDSTEDSVCPMHHLLEQNHIVRRPKSQCQTVSAATVKIQIQHLHLKYWSEITSKTLFGLCSFITFFTFHFITDNGLPQTLKLFLANCFSPLLKVSFFNSNM